MAQGVDISTTIVGHSDKKKEKAESRDKEYVCVESLPDTPSNSGFNMLNC